MFWVVYRYRILPAESRSTILQEKVPPFSSWQNIPGTAYDPQTAKVISSDISLLHPLSIDAVKTIIKIDINNRFISSRHPYLNIKPGIIPCHVLVKEKLNTIDKTETTIKDTAENIAYGNNFFMDSPSRQLSCQITFVWL